MLKTKRRFVRNDITQARLQIPTASVIIVNYNGRSHLDACLKSVLAYSGRDVEVIFVDNQSTDGSADYVDKAYKKVHVIRNKNNGYGAGNNLAARVALGKYLVFLNPDTRVTKGWLDALLLPLALSPHVGMTTPKIALMDEPQRLNTAGNEVHLTGLTLCRGMGEPADAFAEVEEVTAVSGAAFAIKRDLFMQLGGFDGDFFMYMEDTDLSLRARLAGYRSLYVPTSVVYHDYALTFGKQKVYFQERNRMMMMLKLWRWPTLLLLLPALLLAECIAWGFVLLQERQRLLNKLDAYAYIVRHWRSIMRQRKQTQQKRIVSDKVMLGETAVSLAFEQANTGVAAKAANTLFNPLFALWQRVLLAIVRW